MADTYLIIGIITAVITVAGIVATVYWNSRNRKDKIVESRQSLLADVESAATEKQKEEQTLAKEVARENKALAIEVKEDMKAHIDRLVAILKSDINLQKVQAYATMDKIDNKIAQLKIDLMNHIENERDDHTRIQKSIDFLQTMAFGPDAKSIPGYMIDEEETESESPYKGVFASRKDTTGKQEHEPETKEEQDIKSKTESEEKKQDEKKDEY